MSEMTATLMASILERTAAPSGGISRELGRGFADLLDDRQNVVLEMGFFYGRLGREHVAVLYEDGVELPSDTDGIAYIPIDGAGAWKSKLLRELE